MRQFTFKIFITIFSIMSLAFVSNAQCDYTISLEDTWGDGWNGGAVTVLVNGSAVLTDLTLASGTGPEVHAFAVNPGDDVTTTYVAGSYSSENYYQIKDADGIMVAEGAPMGSTPGDIASGTITGACATCAAPIALNATNLTPTSADLNWTEQGTATVWDVEWGTQGFAATGTPTDNDLATTTLSLTGLVSGTHYDFYVRADCGADNTDVSAWAGPYTFVYLEGDNCSNAQDLSTLTSPYSSSTVGYTAGDIAGMTCVAADNGSANRIFFIDVADGTELHIGQTSNSFDSRHNVAYGATCPGDQLIVCTDDPDTEEIVWTNTTGSTQRVYYILAGYSSTSAGDFDLTWSLVTCPDPSALGIANLTDQSVDLTWTTGGAANWDIEWDVTGFAPTGIPTLNDITSNPYSLTGLTAETAYDFYVRDDCGADNTDTSNWVGPFTFTTTAACAMPTDLAASVTDVTADLSWNGYAATNWDIEWDVTGFTPTGTPTINDNANNPFTLTGLTQGVSYDFYVRADCGADNTTVSAWAGPFTFTTVTQGEACSFPFNYGNINDPAIDATVQIGTYNWYTVTLDQEYLDVTFSTCNGAGGDSRLWVFDACGGTQLAYSDDACATLSEYVFPTLAAGTYYVRIDEYGQNDILDYNIEITGRLVSSETDILTYSFTEQTGPATIDATAHTVDIEVGNGTNLTNIVPTYTLSIGATTTQTTNDFSAPVTYTVTAEDAVTVQDWLVTVTEATINVETDILTYSFTEQTGPATIDATAHTVVIEVNWEADVTNLVPTYTLSYGATTTQTTTDFSTPVTYTVTAEDGVTVQDWLVTVSQEATPQGALCSNPLPLTLPVVNEVGNTAGFGDNYDDATMTSCSTFYLGGDDIVYEFTLTQDGYISGDMTSTETYIGMIILDGCPDVATTNCTVISTNSGSSTSFANEPIAAGTYFVIISSWPSPQSIDFDFNLSFTPASEVEITSYTLPGQISSNIDAASDSIMVIMPAGTVYPITLAADFVLSTNATASVGATAQVTGVTDNTWNDNVTPVLYDVLGEDGITTKTWSVYVDVAQSINQVISSNQVSVFPNPNSGQFNVTLNLKTIETVQMEVVNMQGQVVANFNDVPSNATQSFDLSHVADGLYYIRIATSNQTIIKKVNIVK